MGLVRILGRVGPVNEIKCFQEVTCLNKDSFIKGTLLDVQNDQIGRNFKFNGIVLLSLVCIYITEIDFDNLGTTQGRMGILVNIVLGLACACLLAICIPPWQELWSDWRWPFHMFSGLSAFGLAYARIRLISDHIAEYSGRAILRVIIFLGCFFFLYLACMYLTTKILRVLWDSGYWSSIHGVELYVLVGCVLICGAACVWFSCSTELAYTSKLAHDVIYQFDSPVMIRNMVHARFSDPTNGVHQPLFSIFAIPFAGVPYLTQALTGGSVLTFVIFEGFVQAFVIMLGFSMLGFAIGLSRRARICWMLLLASSFSYFLFSLCIEQYAIGFFYTALLILVVSRSGRLDKFAAYGAAGTFTTSGLMFLPAIFCSSSWRAGFRSFIKRTMGLILELAFIMCALMRAPLLDWIFRGSRDMLRFASVSKHALNFRDQIYQTVMMIRSMFLAPKSGALDVSVILGADTPLYPELAGFEVWGQLPVGQFSILGSILILAALTGAWICRDKIWARMAILHLGLGLFLTGVLGFAVSEGNLVLYSLYFGWPVPCLIAGMLQKAKLPAWVLYIFAAAACVIMLWHNIPVVTDMFQFGVTRYSA